jgi:3-hydroxybutyrate dehydrogenase
MASGFSRYCFQTCPGLLLTLWTVRDGNQHMERLAAGCNHANASCFGGVSLDPRRLASYCDGTATQENRERVAMSLKGKVALVTGSTSGIGLGIARALAAEGADVMLNGFGDAEVIAGLQRDIAATFGVRTAHSGADVSVPDEIASMVDRTVREFGGLDILVNNAGVQFTASITEFPTEQWDRIIAINLSSAFHATNIASVHGLVASAQKAAYVAAKHGILGLTKVAALELANTGVTCNAICPGWVLTPLVQKQLDDRAAREGRPLDEVTHAVLSEKQPMVRFSTPESIGGVAVFLCSDAAQTITGTPISIDGGWMAQ